MTRVGRTIGVMRFFALGFLIACGTSESPTPTEAVCPDPDPVTTLSYDTFGQKFFNDYCMMCHSEALLRSQRNGAPLYHDFDKLEYVMRFPEHIDEQSGSGPAADNHFMPPDRCPETPGGPLAIKCKQPTEAERQQLATWLACEINRPHNF